MVEDLPAPGGHAVVEERCSCDAPAGPCSHPRPGPGHSVGSQLHRHLGNRIGLLPVLLPTGPMHTLVRLEAIRDATLRLQRSATPVVSWGLLSSTALLTPPVERAFHRFHQLRAPAY